MGKPRAPTPPDPQSTAAAQTGTNVGTSIANTLMGQVNQVSPNGSLSYAQTGSSSYTDPYTGQTYQIPQFTATQTLSPELQAINAANQGAQLGLANVAQQQAERLGGVLGENFNPTNLPAFGQMPGQSQFQNVSGSAGLNGAPVQAGAIQTGISAPPVPTTAAVPTAVQGGVRAADIPTTAAASTAVQGAVAGGGDIRGNVGNPVLDNRAATGGDITRTYGTDFSADRQRVEQAIMQRLQPQLQRQQESLNTQLANQGIGMGSRAYSAAQGDLASARNDAMLGAILSGGQEQSRLAGLEAQRAGFQNAAQSQAFGQDATNIGMQAQIAGQQFGQNLAGGQFANQAQAQQFGQNLAQGQFANQAAGQAYGQSANVVNQQAALAAQQFGQNLSQGQFANQAAGQAYGQNANAVNQQAALAGQQFNQNLAAGQFGNQAQAQGFGQAMDQRGLFNNTAQQNWQNQFAATGANNANLSQLFGQGMQQFGAQNGLRGQSLQEQLALRNQPINEIAALLSGSQVAMPSFNVAQPSGIPTTDVSGIIGNNYNQQYNNYANQMGLWQSGIGGLFGLGTAGITSGVFGGGR